MLMKTYVTPTLDICMICISLIDIGMKCLHGLKSAHVNYELKLNFGAWRDKCLYIIYSPDSIQVYGI